MGSRFFHFTLTIAALICMSMTALLAQLGNNEVVFHNTSAGPAQLTIQPKGFIFNDELIYDTKVSSMFDPPQIQLLSNNIASYNSAVPQNQWYGFESPWESDQYDQADDVSPIQMLGFGEYTILFGDKVFTLNLIDANWYHQDEAQVRRFLFTYDGTNLYLDVYLGASNHIAGPITNPSVVNVWDFNNQQRDRVGTNYLGSKFMIDAANSSIIPIPSTNVNHAVLDVMTELKGVVTIASGKTIEIKGFVGFETQLKVLSNATLIGNDLSVIQLNSDWGDAQIMYEGSGSSEGKSIFHHPLVLRGIGSIIRANIEWTTHFQVDDQSTLRFKEKGNLSFASSLGKKNIYVNGRLEFYIGQYQFIGDSLDIIYVTSPNTISTSPAKFVTYGGVRLYGIKNIQGWWNSQVLSFGDILHPCTWHFTSNAPMDIYDYVEGNYTMYQGMPGGTSGNQKWAGIFVALDSSAIYLDHCVVQDIFTDQNLSGNAVHLYGTTGAGNNDPHPVNYGNQISYSHIIHDDTDSPGTGNGIFVQVSLDNYEQVITRSYLRLIYSCIFDRWFTGLANAESDVEMEGNSVYGYNQIQGAVCVNQATQLMSDNCIRGHFGRGIYSENGCYIGLNYNFFSPEGHNAVTENGPHPDPNFISAQLVLKSASTLLGGWENFPIAGLNNISHSNPQVKRAYVENSVATMGRNWWGEIPSNCNGDFGTLTPDQENRFFTFISSSTMYGQAKCTIANTRVCSDSCPEGSGFIVPSPPIAGMFEPTRYSEPNLFSHTSMSKTQVISNDLAMLHRLVQQYIARNELDNAYRIVADRIVNSNDVATAAIVTSWAHHFELQRAQKKLESLEGCMLRLAHFISSHLNLPLRSDVKAALLLTLGHVYATLGDVTSLDQVVQKIQTQYGNTGSAAGALDLAQLVAMAARDTVGVDNVIAQMIKAGVSAEKLHVARTMRAGFLRVKSRSQMIKKTFNHQHRDFDEGLKSVSRSEENCALKNYPNPIGASSSFGNHSTTIEYYLPQSTRVQLTVHNLLGQNVAVLVNEEQSAGKHFVRFRSVTSSGNLPAGMYFYRLMTPDQTITRKLNIVK